MNQQQKIIAMVCSENQIEQRIAPISETNFVFLAILFLFNIGFLNYSSAQVNKTITSSLTAEQAYEQGFARHVMRPGNVKGISLEDRILLENDGAGAGQSEKGDYYEPIYKGVLVRKQFYLKNPTARKAHIILFMVPQSKSTNKGSSYYLLVNGYKVNGVDVFWQQPEWRWIDIPVSMLKSGLNDIILGSDMPKGEGFNLLFAREDEYNEGGGKFTYLGNTAMLSADQIEIDGQGNPKNITQSNNSLDYFIPTKEEVQAGLQPIRVGETSAKSVNGGKTWVKGKLGPKNNTSGEYTIRLSLDRYEPEGILDSPPIDLWAGAGNHSVLYPVCELKKLELNASAFLPENTNVIWQIRMANTRNIYDSQWGAWKAIGEGPGISYNSSSVENKRYFQWRAILKTNNPLATPIIKEVAVRREVSFSSLPAQTYYIRNFTNPKHRYTSYRMSFEDINNPDLKSIKKRLNLDSLLKDAQGGFEKMNRIRHYISAMWFHADPFPAYPAWNANEILDRNAGVGAGGMCIQFTIVFMQALQSLGYNVRHVNIFSHEPPEVYVDELGSWVYIDPESLMDGYEFDSGTGKPLSIMDQHKIFLDELGLSPSNPIDWTSSKPWAIGWQAPNTVKFELNPISVGYATSTDFINNPNQPPAYHRLAGFMRFIPRNNFLSKPFPRPLTQGAIAWPWNGYVNWYDEATPRKLEYALQTDREVDFYPTLNRVEYTATYHNGNDGEVEINMFTVTPNFESFEINENGTGWRKSSGKFNWKLSPDALNTLKMRSVNSAGVTGQLSSIEIFWHYRKPFKPRITN